MDGCTKKAIETSGMSKVSLRAGLSYYRMTARMTAKPSSARESTRRAWYVKAGVEEGSPVGWTNPIKDSSRHK